MPQKFQILRCFSCETFNVDIVKKTNLKWQCKMCGENQSIKNVYGTSDTAKECREIAQQLNQRRGEKMDEIQVNFCQKLFFFQKMLCAKIILNVRNNFCPQHVLPRFV